MSDIEVQLSEQPDGFGFFRGTARRGDAVVHVNILPPEHLRAGCIMLEEDVGAALVPLLARR